MAQEMAQTANFNQIDCGEYFVSLVKSTVGNRGLEPLTSWL